MFPQVFPGEAALEKSGREKKQRIALRSHDNERSARGAGSDELGTFPDAEPENKRSQRTGRDSWRGGKQRPEGLEEQLCPDAPGGGGQASAEEEETRQNSGSRIQNGDGNCLIQGCDFWPPPPSGACLWLDHGGKGPPSCVYPQPLPYLGAPSGRVAHCARIDGFYMCFLLWAGSSMTAGTASVGFYSPNSLAQCLTHTISHIYDVIYTHISVRMFAHAYVCLCVYSHTSSSHRFWVVLGSNPSGPARPQAPSWVQPAWPEDYPEPPEKKLGLFRTMWRKCFLLSPVPTPVLLGCVGVERPPPAPL